MPQVTVIGAGLAGCEAALWLANQGVSVRLMDQKPHKMSPAHSIPEFAELVCSNSLKAERVDSAGGLLKEEMRRMGSSLLLVADACRVAAGGALAVDRGAFSHGVGKLVKKNPNISVVEEEVINFSALDGLVIVATGPLTAGPLASEIALLTGQQALSFYDAAAPIVTADSLDESKVFAASRYGRGEADYLNCPFNKEGYEAFWQELANAETAQMHASEEKLKVYEGCMPVEVLAKRGMDTLRFGTMRPVGLVDPATGHRPWANVQLRKENADGTLYNLVGFQTNLKFGEQKRVFGMIPGLQNAEFARYGVMHRNTFLNSPSVLAADQSLLASPNIFFAGQITGVEGYTESMASGLWAARAVQARLLGQNYTPLPTQSMSGALAAYLRMPNADFQPMGANMGLLPSLAVPLKDKRARYNAMAQNALQALESWDFSK